MNLKIMKISEYAHLPTKHDLNDAAFDLYASEDNEILPKATAITHTGICVEIPTGFFGKIETRSSIAKQGIFCTAGVIDSGYRGEIMIVMNNLSEKTYHIKQGDRIAQMVIYRVEEFKIIEANTLDNNLDRGGGFGSSGK